MELRDLFPNFEKNPNLKKNYFFFMIGIFIQSPHTRHEIHKLHGNILQFNGNIVCVIAILFFNLSKMP